MAALADLERLFERLFERSTARLFRARLQPVQIERRVERAMERARSTRGGRIAVPARYRVRLNPGDLDAVASQFDGPQELAGSLADAALAFARAHGYQLPSRPSVAIVADPSLQRGVVEVEPVAALPPAVASKVPDMPEIAMRPETAAADVVPAEAPEVSRAAALVADASPHTVAGAAVLSVLPGESLGEAGAVPGAGGIRGDGTQTLVFRRPAPQPTRAVLRVIGRDGAERLVEVDGTPMTLGRATDNALVLPDSRVSRHHARVQARRGTLVFTDLGSTNGSRVNGIRVDACALGTGDRVLVGDTVLLVEQLPD